MTKKRQIHPIEKFEQHMAGISPFRYSFLPKQISCVYIIRCTKNNSVYIGETKHDLQRAAEHFTELRAGTHHNIFLQNDFTRYGITQFYFKVVTENIKSVKYRQWLESDYIIKAKHREKHLNGAKVYNIKIPSRKDIGFEFKQTYDDE